MTDYVNWRSREGLFSYIWVSFHIYRSLFMYLCELILVTWHITWPFHTYGVVLASRIDQIIGLFCKRDLWKRRYSAKETCNFKEPTNRSHPIRWPDVYSHYTYVSIGCLIMSTLITSCIYTYIYIHQLCKHIHSHMYTRYAHLYIMRVDIIWHVMSILIINHH